ncbi:hypothetical protein D3C84_819160 [compost metagenome]
MRPQGDSNRGVLRRGVQRLHHVLGAGVDVDVWTGGVERRELQLGGNRETRIPDGVVRHACDVFVWDAIAAEVGQDRIHHGVEAVVTQVTVCAASHPQVGQFAQEDAAVSRPFDDEGMV